MDRDIVAYDIIKGEDWRELARRVAESEKRAGSPKAESPSTVMDTRCKLSSNTDHPISHKKNHKRESR